MTLLGRDYRSMPPNKPHDPVTEQCWWCATDTEKTLAVQGRHTKQLRHVSIDKCPIINAPEEQP